MLVINQNFYHKQHQKFEVVMEKQQIFVSLELKICTSFRWISIFILLSYRHCELQIIMPSLFHLSERALQSGPKETYSSVRPVKVLQCWKDPRAQSSVIVLGSRGVSRGKWEWAKHISCWGTKCWRQLWLWSLSGKLHFLLTNAQVSRMVTV